MHAEVIGAIVGLNASACRGSSASGAACGAGRASSAVLLKLSMLLFLLVFTRSAFTGEGASATCRVGFSLPLFHERTVRQAKAYPTNCRHTVTGEGASAIERGLRGERRCVCQFRTESARAQLETPLAVSVGTDVDSAGGLRSRHKSGAASADPVGSAVPASNRVGSAAHLHGFHLKACNVNAAAAKSRQRPRILSGMGLAMLDVAGISPMGQAPPHESRGEDSSFVRVL
jgi:hypothetical protein